MQLPASWAIPTAGRDNSIVEEEDVDEAPDDAVCQVCFDGESGDSNPIVFCDKCNIAIHKVHAQPVTVSAPSC